MAKVMVSLPDDLLAAIDAEARRRGETRSGLLRHYAEEALLDRELERARKIDAIFGEGRPHDGRGAEHIRRMRDER